MELDTRPLFNLLAIARLGSFSRAAKARGLSQPALSNSIAQLEKRVGARLLARGRHGATLTEAGRTLVRNAELIEIQMRRAGEELTSHAAGVQGPITVGVTPVSATHLVPRALGRLTQEVPQAVASVNEIIFAEAMAQLRNGSLDLMVGPIGVYPSGEDIVEESLVTDPFHVIVRTGHPLARRRKASLRELADAAWVLPSEASAYHHQLEALFVVAGVRWPAAHIATNSMTAMKAIVINSDCVAIMPKQLVALERRAGLVVTMDLAEAGVARSLGLSYARARPLPPLALRFAEILRRTAKEKPFRG